MPASLRALSSRWKIARIRATNQKLTTSEVFDRIYRGGLWGGSQDHPSSGFGSSGRAAHRYIETIVAFARTNNVRTILDIGCGDFYIGSAISDRLSPNLAYIGADVSPFIIERNIANFETDAVKFVCLDATRDDMPAADLCLIRQVLQHLSNDQISRILANTAKYDHLVVTEHHPPIGQIRSFNLDKPHGPDTRVDDDSGVFLDRPPFNRSLELLLAVEAKPTDSWHGQLLTWRVANNGMARPL